jgi:archaemetzincin
LNADQPELAGPPHLEIIPMGRVDTMAVSVVAANLQAILGLNTQTQQIRPEPAYAFLPRRSQYEAGKILHQLASDTGIFTLGVVNVDIYTPILTFVFGESQLGGKAAIISTFRIQGRDSQTTYKRAAKIGVHEVGHLLGIVHCRAPDCLMGFSNSLTKLDSLPLRFCQACEYEARRSLRHLFGNTGRRHDDEKPHL